MTDLATDIDTYEPATQGRIELSYGIEVDHHATLEVEIAYLPTGQAITPDSLEEPLDDLYHGLDMDSPRREEAFTDQVYQAIEDTVAPGHLQVAVEPRIDRDINHDHLYHVARIEQTGADETGLFSED